MEKFERILQVLLNFQYIYVICDEENQNFYWTH